MTLGSDGAPAWALVELFLRPAVLPFFLRVPPDDVERFLLDLPLRPDAGRGWVAAGEGSKEAKSSGLRCGPGAHPAERPRYWPEARL